jgi:hypothetical protein
LAAGSIATLASGRALADVEPAGDTYVNPRKVLLWESTRKEFREALEGGVLKAVILPTGSTEQHNEHLAMINDTARVTLVAQKAALLLYPQGWWPRRCRWVSLRTGWTAKGRSR